MDSKIVFDVDDLCDDFNPWDELHELKAAHPDLKVTLFAIPGRCSDGLLARYRALDWVELGVHGYHHSSRECSTWGYDEAVEKLAEGLAIVGGAKVFRPPGWCTNQELTRALFDGGWVGADHAAHSQDWGPEIALRYVYNDAVGYTSIHGHTWETCQNGPSTWVRGLRDVEGEFVFVSEAAVPYHFDHEQEHRNSWNSETAWGERAKRRMEQFLGDVKPDGAVADFGGNDGTAAAYGVTLGHDVCVVDGSPSRVEFAKAAHRLKAHRVDLGDMPFADNEFDWGFTSHTLEHLHDVEGSIKEIKRVCRYGLWVVVPVESDEQFAKDPAHKQQFTHEGWLDLLGAVEVSRGDNELVCRWNRP